MRGLNKAYDDLIEKVNKFFSKDELLKKAKNKLLKGESANNYDVLMSQLPTQNGVGLLCICSIKTIDCKFVFAIPVIEYSHNTIIDDRHPLFEYSSSYSSLATNKVYKLLKKELDNHRKLCKSNIVAEFGNLKIGYYNCDFNEANFNLVGVVNDEIVFMFVIETDSLDLDVKLKEDEYLVFSIPFGKDTGTLNIRVDDYSIV